MTAAQVAEAQRLAREWKPKTQAAKALPKSSSTPPAISSETVKSTQTFLAALGYNPGPADGILGFQTRNAIEAFQRDHGLPVTGEVSSNKMRVLLLQEMARQKAGLAPTKVELSD